ncbi:MAG: penicillin-binding transpeptidase domain-containing protein [Gammaproteobacteria bacterium]|nr:penicillin-binding transpeptidase domain-containing protein [Gammaproteobacteria bacterium]
MSKHLHKPASRFRLSIVYVAVSCATLMLVWRVVDLHVFHKDFLQNQGDARYLRVVPIPAHRGMILDRHGEPLAISTPVDSVWVQPTAFSSAYNEWPKLAKLLQLDLANIQRTISQRKDKEFVYLKRHISPDLASRVMALELPGVNLQREYHRYYPAGEVAAHVLGFSNVDDRGQEGLELAYDDWLKGVQGSQRVLKDRLGRVVRHVEQIRKPVPGRDLTLSLDRRLQYLAYRELKRAVLQHKARSGSAVILDVHSGEVLAMVNQPSYNPNNRDQFKGSQTRNRAVTDLLEPGSTVKPFTVVAALESGRFRASSLVDTTPGQMRLGKAVIRDSRNYGQISLATVIQKSSNVGASKIALALPDETLWKVHARLGFGSATDSGFPGEAEGLLSHARHWRDIEKATLAYGYGLSVTPLQLARAYSVLATNGIVKPVSFTRTDDVIEGERIIAASTTRQVNRMLEAVVQEGGTGTRAQIAGYKVAGKTGTVKKAVAGGYSDDRYIAVFAGIAPASQPRLAMVVTINEPRGDIYYGGEVAAPVFSKVMAGALRMMGVPPDDVSLRPLKIAVLNHSAGGRP